MEIVSGFGTKCKDSLGGINKLWLCVWEKHSHKEIIVDDNYLQSFPPTIIYQFNSLQNPVFSETYNRDSEYWDQTISLVFPKIEGKKLRYLKCEDYRIIIQDRNGIYHIFGLYTGLQISTSNYTTGSQKNELNGIRFDFTAKEEKGSFIINNLEDVGFIDNGTEETFYLLFESKIPIILQNNNNLIIK